MSPQMRRGLLEKFFRFVHFGSQIRTASSVRVIEQHELAVAFSYFLLGQHPITAYILVKFHECFS